MRSRVGFSPTRPQFDAGIRIEPAPSEAVAAAQRPAATAAALPPLDPPALRSGVPRVARDAERRPLGVAHDRQLGKVGLADHHGARGAQTAHELAVIRDGGEVGRRAPGRYLAGHVLHVLDRDRHAQERPLVTGATAPVGLLRVHERALVHDVSERVQLRVEALDPLEVEDHELARGHIAAADQLRLAGDSCEGEVIPVHASRNLTRRPPSQRGESPARG